MAGRIANLMVQFSFKENFMVELRMVTRIHRQHRNPA